MDKVWEGEKRSGPIGNRPNDMEEEEEDDEDEEKDKEEEEEDD